MVQRWWFKSGEGGNVITAASGMGGLVYIVVQWVRYGMIDVMKEEELHVG